MEKIVEQGLLYDFYGELLTDHQRHVYEDVVFNDMSLSEIAEEQGISRQGVHDLIKRCDRILAGYEEKLRMVEKFNLDNITMGQNYLLFACCIVVIAVFSYLLLHVNDKVVQLLKKEAK